MRERKSLWKPRGDNKNVGMETEQASGGMNHVLLATSVGNANSHHI